MKSLKLLGIILIRRIGHKMKNKDFYLSSAEGFSGFVLKQGNYKRVFLPTTTC